MPTARRSARIVRGPVVAAWDMAAQLAAGSGMGNRRTTRPSRTSTVSGPGRPGARPHLDVVAGGHEGEGQVPRHLLDPAERRGVGARDSATRVTVDPGRHGRARGMGDGSRP